MKNWDEKKRSEFMAKIRGKDTKPEIRVRKYLFSQGFRYRKNVKKLPGKPDIVLPKYKVIIFVHGCFWHGHEVDGRVPTKNTEFWINKINKNKERDLKTQKELESIGWKVIIIWECEISTKKKRESTLQKLVEIIKSQEI